MKKNTTTGMIRNSYAYQLYLLGTSYKEIAEKMGISVKWARVRVSRGAQKAKDIRGCNIKQNVSEIQDLIIKLNILFKGIVDSFKLNDRRKQQ
jgi:transposase